MIDKSARPKIKLEFTITDKVVELISLILLILLWVIALINFSSLPSAIPSHFNFAGKIDSYGSRGTIFLLPAIGTAIYAVFTLLTFFPHIYNYPVKITPENAAAQYRLAVSLLRYLKAGIQTLFLVILFMVIRTSFGEPNNLNLLVFAVLILFIFAPLIFFIVKMSRLK